MKKTFIYTGIIFVIVVTLYSYIPRKWELHTRLIDHKGWTFEVYEKQGEFKVIQFTDGFRMENKVDKYIRMSESTGFLFWKNEYGKFDMSISYNLSKDGAKGYITFNDSVVRLLQPIVFPLHSKVYKVETASPFLDTTGFIKNTFNKPQTGGSPF